MQLRSVLATHVLPAELRIELRINWRNGSTTSKLYSAKLNNTPETDVGRCEIRRATSMAAVSFVKFVLSHLRADNVSSMPDLTNSRRMNDGTPCARGKP